MPGSIRKLLNWVMSPPSGGSGIPVESPSERETNRFIEKIKNGPDDLRWMFPPGTVSDPAAWDQYWTDQIDTGRRIRNMFVNDGQLVDAMVANGIRTVLCVGNGISHEARALSEAGFAVTALDLSPVAVRVAAASVPDRRSSGAFSTAVRRDQEAAWSSSRETFATPVSARVLSTRSSTGEPCSCFPTTNYRR